MQSNLEISLIIKPKERQWNRIIGSSERNIDRQRKSLGTNSKMATDTKDSKLKVYFEA